MVVEERFGQYAQSARAYAEFLREPLLKLESRGPYRQRHHRDCEKNRNRQ